MKVQIENISNLQKKVNVEVPANIVTSAFNKVFNDVQKNVELKGFRKGKAPIHLIKSMYGERVKQDVAQDLIQMHYSQVLRDHKLEPVNYPEFEFDDPSEDLHFKFSATFDVRPEVKLQKTTGLEVDKEKFSVTDDQIEKSVQNILQNRSELVDILEDRPVQKGDVTLIDFEGFVDGKPLENGAGKDFELEIGAHQFIEGFEEGLIGAKIGEERTLNLKFPDPYHAAEIAGKPVDFKTTVRAIKKKVLPELNAEFFEKNASYLARFGGAKNLDELKAHLKKDLESSEVKRIEDSFKNRLLKKLVEANPVEVPNSLLAEQKKALIEDFKNRMTQQGMTDSEYQSYVEKWDADFAKTASEMIQTSFLIDAIAKEKDLFCKKEDVDAKLEAYATQTGIELARIKEWYSNQEQLSRLTYSITEEKVVKYLTDSAKIKEVSKDQLKDELN